MVGKVRNKFRLVSVDKSNGTPVVTLAAQYDTNPSGEDAQFSQYTPFGELKFGCDNPRALEMFEQGTHEFYIDITPVSA